MKVFRAAALAGATLALSAQAPPERYAVGQVWAYHVRPGDEGSLLKIQSIENVAAFARTGPVYHISVVGFHFRNPQMSGGLPHSPVTREVLDRSVTVLHPGGATFPDAAPGIAQWREAKGGVYTITVAEIVELVDRQTEHLGGN